MEFKSLDIKEQSKPGTFVGFASLYNVVDFHDDVVLPGAYDRTYRENGGEIVILADHNPEKSIGLSRMTLKPEGLWLDATLSLDLTDGRDAYIRMRDLKKSGLSIGYTVPPGGSRFRKDGVRELLDITLLEVSSVQFPALDSARVQSVKHRNELAELTAGLKRLAAQVTAYNADHRTPTPAPVHPAVAELDEDFRKLNSLVSLGDVDDAAWFLKSVVRPKLARLAGEQALKTSFEALGATLRSLTATLKKA